MVFSNILLTHRIVVTLFLVHYVIKLALLLLDKKEPLVQYTKGTRVAEMIISLLFLLTGGWMLFYSGHITTLMIVKLLFVFASIPIAIIGFKKGNKALAALAVLLILGAYGLAEVNKKKMAGGKVDTTNATNALAAGKEVYAASCVTCHGDDGKKGLMGAKDLSQTMLGIDAQKDIIQNGKNAMPGNKNLTPDQLEAVVEYIGTLKK